MHTDFYTFGEILWDCLPAGNHAGGAPFNVAIHLAQLGASVSILSAVGQDALGNEILQLARDKGVNASLVGCARTGLRTGTVLVTLDSQSNATYEIVQPSAWDEINVSPETLELVSQARGLVFGSLAARSLHNRDQLLRLLNATGPTNFFDVNLRPPFDNLELVTGLAEHADVIKVNDHELGALASWIKTGRRNSMNPRDEAEISAACAILAERTNTSRICVTRGSEGATFWNEGIITSAPAPQVTVCDTIGAGDAFMAGLVLGLSRGESIPRLLEKACRLGAYVASHHGATPLLPSGMVREFQPPAGDAH